jgi:hypothetical protein
VTRCKCDVTRLRESVALPPARVGTVGRAPAAARGMLQILFAVVMACLIAFVARRSYRACTQAQRRRLRAHRRHRVRRHHSQQRVVGGAVIACYHVHDCDRARARVCVRAICSTTARTARCWRTAKRVAAAGARTRRHITHAGACAYCGVLLTLHAQQTRALPAPARTAAPAGSSSPAPARTGAQMRPPPPKHVRPRTAAEGGDDPAPPPEE